MREYLRSMYGFEVRRKKTSVLMWMLYVVGFMWVWNRRFMTDFVTTIPFTSRVYLPDDLFFASTDSQYAKLWEVLGHEGRHGFDSHTRQTWFAFSYLFPQCLALLALLAIPFSLWWLVALVALGPWPAPWRARWEREAYRVSTVLSLLQGWDIGSPYYKEEMVAHFGKPYYFMVWRTSVARRWVDEDVETAKRLIDGTMSDLYTTSIISIVKAYK